MIQVFGISDRFVHFQYCNTAGASPLFTNTAHHAHSSPHLQEFTWPTQGQEATEHHLYGVGVSAS